MQGNHSDQSDDDAERQQSMRVPGNSGLPRLVAWPVLPKSTVEAGVSSADGDPPTYAVEGWFRV